MKPRFDFAHLAEAATTNLDDARKNDDKQTDSPQIISFALSEYLMQLENLR